MREDTGGLKLVMSPRLFSSGPSVKVLVIVKEIWLMCFLSFSLQKNMSNLSLNDLNTSFILSLWSGVSDSYSVGQTQPPNRFNAAHHLKSTYDKTLLLFVVVCLCSWGGATGMWCYRACVYNCVKEAWHPIQSNVETDALTEECTCQMWKMTLAVHLSC